MKVELYFKNLLLGEFFQKDNKLYYNSNLSGENEFCKSCFNSMFYDLKNSNCVKIEQLPKFLEGFKEAIENPKFIFLAKIKDEDSLFVKLCKLSLIKFDNFEYNLKLKQN